MRNGQFVIVNTFRHRTTRQLLSKFTPGPVNAFVFDIPLAIILYHLVSQ
jgi:hypothetical protein